MRKDCDSCLHNEFGETYCNDCYWAAGKPPTKWEPAPYYTPDTNADRIRAMTDEELAKLIANTPICNEKWSECWKIGCDCDSCLLEWLKQPAEE